MRSPLLRLPSLVGPTFKGLSSGIWCRRQGTPQHPGHPKQTAQHSTLCSSGSNTTKNHTTYIRNIMTSASEGQQQPQQQVKFLNQDEAINLDRELFDDYAFSVDQLMELAGLSVATAVARSYPLDKHDKPIVCCGPGNNGGDGLVCARHLKLFGYSPIIVCLKPGRSQLYQNLLTQCRKFQITIVDQMPNQPLDAMGNLIIDCVFGFSFKPPNRNPDFARLLKLMHESSGLHIPLVSVDIPSGWHVEYGDGNIDDDQADVEASLKVPALKPDCLISLTAPKQCAKSFKGRFHYLGGRFCPKSLQEKYKLNLPEYPGTEGVLLLNNNNNNK